jgi:hypothetical protein
MIVRLWLDAGQSIGLGSSGVSNGPIHYKEQAEAII